jgi:hypothetical protein
MMQETPYWLLDPPAPEDYDTSSFMGSSTRWGDHPPKKPISYVEWEVMATVAEIDAQYSDPTAPIAASLPEHVRLNILQTNENVRVALQDDKIVWGPWGYASCLLWSRSDAGAIQRIDFNNQCVPWDDALKHAIRVRNEAVSEAKPYQQAVVPPGETTPAAAMTEVGGAEVDLLDTLEEQAALTVSDPECDWWCQAKAENPWLKSWLLYGAVAAGGLIGARVLLPPLYKTWLDRPRKGPSEGPGEGRVARHDQLTIWEDEGPSW